MQASCIKAETSSDPRGRHQRLTGEDTMDLAMTIGIAMFGMFGASTVLFLYKLKP
jgi:hypothetical protein